MMTFNKKWKEGLEKKEQKTIRGAEWKGNRWKMKTNSTSSPFYYRLDTIVTKNTTKETLTAKKKKSERGKKR